ncbi:cell cycle checkpoint control protein rad9b [Plakobranchus ocellatus]|uniref:Cell cycle checkpoint control protein RAD9A n=1 Tax=Plakobranchus ocellatus TaxID=259542 RepID=A0AAV3ZFZ5_9GAST|nr:cell cycle checkpoint control protein rad9b [Plakobranchus ocellatus]
MTFKCTIPGVSLKVFGRAIQSLSKIGDELYFEPREDGLFLRSVNSCRSAYACFQFAPNFFDHYVDVSLPAEMNEDEDEAFRCKIGMKSIMSVFRNLVNIDKTVEKCRISFNSDEDRLVFQMYCRHGIIKTHKLAFIECETLQAVSSKDMCPNKITSLPKLLCDAVLNFQANQEEITLIVRPDFLALQNYVDDDQDKSKVMRTEVTLSPDEFDQYQVGVDTDITFCLKELRAILAFADLTNLPLSLHFEGAGRPITFSITGDLSYEATFVLATLAEVEGPGNGPSSSQVQTNKLVKSSREQFHGTNHSSARLGKTASQLADQNAERRLEHEDRQADTQSDEQTMSFAVEDVSITNPASFVNRFEPGRKDNSSSIDNYKQNTISRSKQKSVGRNSCREATISDQHGRSGRERRGQTPAGQRVGEFESGNEDSYQGDFNNCDNRLAEVEAEQPVAVLPQAREENRLISAEGLEPGNSGSPVIPIQNADFSTVDDVDEEEEDDDEVPATPPSKKFRSVFFGTQSSTQPSQSQSKAAILALNSDSDD